MIILQNPKTNEASIYSCAQIAASKRHQLGKK